MDFISFDRMLGLNYSGRKGFGKILPWVAWKKFGRDQNQIKTQNKKGLFISNETKTRKRIFERANLEDGF